MWFSSCMQVSRHQGPDSEMRWDLIARQRKEPVEYCTRRCVVLGCGDMLFRIFQCCDWEGIRTLFYIELSFLYLKSEFDTSVSWSCLCASKPTELDLNSIQTVLVCAPLASRRAVRMNSVSLSLSLSKNPTPLTHVVLIPEHTYTYLTDAYQDSPRIVGMLDSTRMQILHQSKAASERGKKRA